MSNTGSAHNEVAEDAAGATRRGYRRSESSSAINLAAEVDVSFPTVAPRLGCRSVLKKEFGSCASVS